MPRKITSAPSSTNTSSTSDCDMRAAVSFSIPFPDEPLGNPLDAHLLQNYRGSRPVASIAWRFGDFIRHVLPFHHFTENRVAIVQPRRSCNGDEELAAVGIRPGIGHRQFSGFRLL